MKLNLHLPLKSKMLPKISIITPTFNQGQFIEQTIKSVLDQGYPNLEYIIIDGSSTDNTVDIIKKYEDQLSYWISEPDKGQSDAINKGLRIANGEIINWLNSDDYYEPNSLFEIAKAFEDESINCVCARSNIFEDGGKILYQSKGTDIYSNVAKTIGWARIDQPETFFRKSAIDKMGDVSSSLHYIMDKEWWIRYLLLYGISKIKQIDYVVVNFRLHQNSKTVAEKTLFQPETNGMFYNLAKTLQLNEKVILDHCEVDQNAHLNFTIDKSNVVVTLISSFYYYLLYMADYNYAIGNNKTSKAFLAAIDKEQIEKEDHRLYRKLKLRNTLLPNWIKKIKN